MNTDCWRELAIDACTHAGVEYGSIETIATWDQEFCANAVYAIGGRRYLKIFGPTAARQFQAERSVLQTLKTYTEIPAPRVVATGEPAQRPPYLILTQIPGSTAEDVWEHVPRAEQLAVAAELGSITAAIHRLPQQDLAAVEQQFGGRTEHVQTKQAHLIAQIEATETVPIQRRDEMIRFLQDEARTHLNEPITLTHSELAHNHIYLSQVGAEEDRWVVSGFIDWADAMLGPPEWDVTFLWFWTFTRDAEAMRACLQTLYRESRPPDRFARRCLAAILHTHSGPGLWAEFAARGSRSGSAVRAMTEYPFPADLFGAPD